MGKSADPFSSPKRRLERARQHINDVKSRVGSFFSTRPYTNVIEQNENGFDEHKLKLTTPLPDIITDITYEAIEALRSTLDQAIYAIAVAINAPQRHKFQFPIAETPEDFEKGLRGKCLNFPEQLLTLLRSFQPYRGGNTLIWALNQIRRQCNHRLIVPVGNAISGISVDHMTISSPTQAYVPSPVWNREKDEIVYAVGGPGSHIEYKLQLYSFIAFGEVDGFSNKPVVETLEAIAAEVYRIIMALEDETRRIGLID